MVFVGAGAIGDDLFAAEAKEYRTTEVVRLDPPYNNGSAKIYLESISFNHNKNDNSGADAINIRKNFTEPVHIPEWVRGSEKGNPVAYFRNTNVTVTIIAEFSADNNVFNAKIGANRIGGRLGNLKSKQEIIEFSTNTTVKVPFELDTPIPGEIDTFVQEWEWYYKEINGSPPPGGKVEIGRSYNQIFIVFAVPQSPWKTSGQSEPWTDALEWSCKWANGEMTREGAAGKITQALFKTVGGRYDTMEGRARYTKYDDCDWEETECNGAPFALTNFINNFPKVDVVNCNDMGKSLVAFSNVVGCDMSYQSVYYLGGYLNCIYVIGRCWTNNPFYERVDLPPIMKGDSDYNSGRTYFSDHAFGSISGNVFDACLKVDNDSFPDYGPPFTETWMINQPWDQYEKRLIDKSPRLPYPKTWTPVDITFDIY
jgi:hypothetical protein